MGWVGARCQLDPPPVSPPSLVVEIRGALLVLGIGAQHTTLLSQPPPRSVFIAELAALLVAVLDLVRVLFALLSRCHRLVESTGEASFFVPSTGLSGSGSSGLLLLLRPPALELEPTAPLLLLASVAP
jgi:hypothetical protein